jgi:hypothetical protein
MKHATQMQHSFLGGIGNELSAMGDALVSMVHSLYPTSFQEWETEGWPKIERRVNLSQRTTRSIERAFARVSSAMQGGIDHVGR